MVNVLKLMGLLNLDSFVFGIHCKVTTVFLLAFSIVVAFTSWFGEAIDCTDGQDRYSSARYFLNSYCWVHSTYEHNKASEEDDSVRYHKYYKWVGTVLFIQALLFYFPRYLWKTWEAGRMKMLLLHLNCPIITEESRRELILLADCLMKNLHRQNVYAVSYFVCEVLNLVNVIAQFFLIGVFLGGDFSTYGIDVWRSMIDPEGQIDPMFKIFPKAAKCTYHSYRSYGGIQRTDAICLLHINNLNEKIYLFIWFWFIFLAVMSTLSLFYRLAILLSAQIRMHLLRARARFVPPKYVKLVSRKCQIGDWFVLFLLAKNMDPVLYEELICDLANRLEKESSSFLSFPLCN